MKSFIRYLYEYQNGKRTRNTGFVKVLEQTDTAEIQIYGRGFPVAGGRTLEIYLFYEEDGKCIGIRMGEIRGAQAAFGYKLSYTTDDVGGDGQFGRIGRMQNPGQTYRTQTTYAQPGGLLRWCWSMILLNLLCNCCCGGWGFRGFRM